MRVFIVSDAWRPQVNGVVRTLEMTAGELEKMGHDVRVLGPDTTRFFAFALPFYPEIGLEFFARARLEKELIDFAPDIIHLATEGPLGWAARVVCLSRGLPFTTSYHTRFPAYLAKRSPGFLAPWIASATEGVLRRFHAPSSAVLAPTDSVEKDLKTKGYKNVVRWSRGVDTDVFKPYGKDFEIYRDLPRPILLYVGRVSVEKNLRAFLELDVPGSKVVIGDGPDREGLQEKFGQAHFLGPLHGEALARHYASADVFVFPSKTDTFGLVLLEACAAGLRIAAFPAEGPADIFADEKSKTFAVLDENLQNAVRRALELPEDPEEPRAFASRFSWRVCAEQFLAHAAPLPAERDFVDKRRDDGCEKMTKIAFQGAFGANSDMACRAVFSSCETVPCFGFDDAFDAVCAGRADLAMIPVENSVAGRVADVHHLLPQGRLHIIGEHYQPIEHHLLAMKGTKLDEVKVVESHVQALMQCQRWLKSHGIKPVIHADTAGAAEKVSKKGDHSVAAIASSLAAEIYGLESLATGIADGPKNTTRFLILSREAKRAPPGSDCITTLVFRVRSVPAALYKALGGFATNGVNITKLESYLVEGNFTAAQFYVDVEGHPEGSPLRLALEELAFFAHEVKILGVYPAHPFRHIKND